MPAEQRRQFRALWSLALLAGAALLALPVDNGIPSLDATATSATLFEEPKFVVQLGRNRLQISGATVSAEHEAALLQLAGEQFADTAIDTDFRMAVALNPDWETLSTRLLYLVAAMDSAQAILDASGIVVRGIRSDGPNYEHRQKFLHDAAGASHSLTTDVIFMDDDSSFDELCRRNFASFASEPIRFRLSGTDIREASYPLLDKLAEFAYDCSASGIAIVGHSDATGGADWNLQISRARAEAVAAELQRRGVPREQLTVEGRGATQPVADNETVAGREQNRRIELELR
jgi:outer membrane protein OmpA-like peptidoglycan-associated protein